MFDKLLDLLNTSSENRQKAREYRKMGKHADAKNIERENKKIHEEIKRLVNK